MEASVILVSGEALDDVRVEKVANGLERRSVRMVRMVPDLWAQWFVAGLPSKRWQKMEGCPSFEVFQKVLSASQVVRTQPGTRIASIGRPLVADASRSGLHLIRQAPVGLSASLQLVKLSVSVAT